MLISKNSTVNIKNTQYYGYDYTSRAILNNGTLTSTRSTYNANHVNNNQRSKYLVGIENYGILTSNYDTMNTSHGRTSAGVYNSSTNAVVINNITVNNSNSNESYGIRHQSGENTSINGGEVTVTGNNNGFGLYVNSGLITTGNVTYKAENSTGISRGAYLNGGTLNFESGSAIGIGAPTSYGIQLNTGTINLGVEDGRGTDSAEVSTEYPYVKGIGTTTGIGLSMGNATFNYYDGKLVGSTSARGLTDITSNTEKNYQVINGEEEETGYKYCILEFIK